MSPLVRRIVTVVLALAVTAVLAGCSAADEVPESIAADARWILAEHDLQPDGDFSAGSIELADGDQSSALVIEAAGEGGWDLSRYTGEQLKTARVKLAERSQSAAGDVFAVAIYRDDEILGAYLELAGYVPGLVGVDDRYAFLPAGASPSDLVSTRITTVTVAGPWTGESWGTSSTMTARGDIDAFVSGLERSSEHSADRKTDVSGGEWAFTLHYDDGAQLVGRIRGSSAEAWLEYDAEALGRAAYVPDRDVMNEVIHRLTVW